MTLFFPILKAPAPFPKRGVRALPDEAAPYELSHFYAVCEFIQYFYFLPFKVNPITLRKAKIACNFGPFEYNRVKELYFDRAPIVSFPFMIFHYHPV